MADDDLVQSLRGALSPPKRPVPTPASPEMVQWLGATLQRGRPPSPDPQPPAPPEMVRALGTVLQGGLTPAPQPAPAAPASAAPLAGGLTLDQIIDEALANPEAGKKPIYLSADDLAALGADASGLQAVISRRSLHAVTDCDRRGGVWIAHNRAVLSDAERRRAALRPVPIIIAMQET